MRKILVITGTRAEYGILKPVLKAIKKNQKLELLLLATGMHLSSVFGYTAKEIEKDGFKIDFKVKMLLKENSKAAMAESLGKGIMGMTKVFKVAKPDVVVVCGDRSEPFAAAIAGAYLGIPVAHLLGGDSAAGSNIDDSIRHAITKFAHIHFAASKDHADRIVKLGEDRWRVFATGSPAIDSILEAKKISNEEVVKKFNLNPKKPIILVIQHPTSINSGDAGREMRETLNAIAELKHQTVLIYPNADAGSKEMIKVIQGYKKFPFIKTFRSLSSFDYLSLMNVASAMVGNSSSGIIEASSFGLPVINIGLRQRGRKKTKNVIDVDHNKKEIKSAIEKALYDKSFRAMAKNYKNPYGDGKTGIRIADILSKIKINRKLLQKKITY